MGNSSQVKAITGQALPLVGNDIDTDRIIPARFLRAVTFDGLGDQVFADDRQQLADHPFNQPQYQGAKILVVNRNFGCGSSREHAPQAIARWGIKALVGESFAEIFFGNCVAMGVPCVTAAPDDISALQSAIAADATVEVTLDLEKMSATAETLSIPVEMGAGPRQMFLNGTWDACGQLVAQASAIAQTAEHLPYTSWAS
ncbi:3-isopropylmalate dehydratase small subunit [cf. Phormidesmis sp. LEGE 11477]|uniref:3-isopropylmalate dehydratase small subunit n=1 Tax=cf. Phormidesmis sp. LEGE 11477 TaxID=1828680 RepID=UPI001882FB6D|nr:3-isopropylmalate dehydratase small subunit [cf. Phormidesmis sp. LEGE 11477]MBE9060523.1 3-isopropylmalate dehydratase small subunit [cf. Phormidesmis sp. LEGE 11477]